MKFKERRFVTIYFIKRVEGGGLKEYIRCFYTRSKINQLFEYLESHITIFKTVCVLV